MSITLTLAAPARAQTLVRHSRFLAQAAPVASPQAAAAFIAQTRDPAATHNCWAWRIGQTYRSSDDGEPGGTAGRPILAAIDGAGLDQVVTVVSRWFGGIKLGAGGLVRAYGGAAAQCLREAQRVEHVAHVELELGCRFDDLGAVHAAVSVHTAQKVAETFHADGVYITLRLPSNHADALKKRLCDTTRGRVRFSS